jgi:DNA polymerase-3 subunit epsilon
MAAAYNLRVEEAIDALLQRESYAIIDKGIEKNEYSCILVDSGRFYGMGYLPADVPHDNIDMLKDHIKPLRENFFIRELLKSPSIPTRGRYIYFRNQNVPA